MTLGLELGWGQTQRVTVVSLSFLPGPEPVIIDDESPPYDQLFIYLFNACLCVHVNSICLPQPGALHFL